MSVIPTGASRMFPIIGDPITYVESPTSLTKTFSRRGRDAVCIPLQVPQGALDACMTGLTAMPNVDGILVTMPHKHAAFAYCATASEHARLLSVVSVMRRNPDDTWHGAMLDGQAFVAAQQTNGATIDGRRALLLGAGSAGSAIAAALLDAGVAELVIHDRDDARVRELAATLDSIGDGRVTSGSGDPSGFDLVFNATPMGMDNDDPVVLDTSKLSSSMFVGDVIAGHGITPLIAAAREIGCGTATGSDMVAAVQDLMADFLLGA